MLYQKSNLKQIRYLKKEGLKVSLVHNNILNRQQVFKTISEFNDELGLLLASAFYKNTNITGFVFEEEKLIGYLEDFCVQSPYGYKTNEPLLFAQHCEENIYLSKFGYINFDPATLNFFQGINIGFDKSAVVSINNMPKNVYDIYLILFNYSYQGIPLTYIHQIQKAMKTRDELIIHNTFKKIYQELK